MPDSGIEVDPPPAWADPEPRCPVCGRPLGVHWRGRKCLTTEGRDAR